MNSTDLTTPLVRRHYRRTRGTLLVWSLASVSIAAAMTVASRLGWMKQGHLWAALPAVAAAILLVAWFRRVRGLSEARVAQELDQRWQLSARLETAVELSTENTPLASAQRTEAAQRVAGRQPNTALWSLGVFALTLALCFLGVESALFAWRAWRASSAATPLTAEATAAAAATASKAAEEAPAAITWKTPEAEIKATPIEEVPLKALAESAAGFQAMTLEISVNGEHQLSRSLNAAELGDTTNAGSHELALVLALDEVGAKPFDIVSYHLAGERNASTSKRPVTSPEQFIQIKPLNETIAERGRVTEEVMRMRALLAALKLAQLQLIQQNFRLSQLSEAKTDPLWKTQNALAADEQTKLAAQAAEAASYAREKALPPLLDTNLTAAGKAMIDAGKKIAATENEDARAPQGRALALITECEKLFGRARQTEGPIPPSSPINDPFRDTSKTELPPRAEGPAGELEQLAREQRQANQAGEQPGQQDQPGQQPGQQGQSGESKQPSPPQQSRSTQAGQAGGGLGEVIPSQDEIARDALKLADDASLDAPVQELVLSAANGAGAAARQIALGDRAAAREPAGAAQLALEQAVNALDRAGRELAVAELDQARRTLNSASRTAAAGDRARQLAAVRDELRAAAIQQQRTGSATAARELAALADSINARAASPEGTQPGSPERAREAASAAARAQVALGARVSTLNRAVRQLQRAQQSLSNGVPTSGLEETLATLETASQAAEWLTNDSTTTANARALAGQADALLRAPDSADSAKLGSAATAARQLATALENARSIGQRDEVVRRFKVEDIDPAYRPAVESYFERLSREGAKAQPAAPAQK